MSLLLVVSLVVVGLVVVVWEVLFKKIYYNYIKLQHTNTKGANAYDFFIDSEKAFEKLRQIAQLNPSDSFVHVWLGPLPIVLATNPASAKFVLKSPNIVKTPLFANSPYVHAIFGNHLLSVNGDEWKKHKAIVGSGFTNTAYETYFSTFITCIQKAMQVIENKQGKDMDLKDLASRLTIDLLSLSIFHYDFHRLDGGNDKLYEDYKTLINFVLSPFGRLVKVFPWLDSLPLAKVKELHAAADRLRDAFRGIIEERKGVSHGDVLDNLLSAYNNQATNSDKFTEVDLLSNLWVLFLAGHETTSTALMWHCVLLAKYPHHQQKLRKEIEDSLGRDTVPTLADLDKLVALECFIQESLRIHPPVDFLPSRVTTEDITYEKHFIPKGTVVGTLITNIHVHPQYWGTDALTFNPDRFLPENKKGRHNFAFLPFSLGPRQCIGNQFSLIEQHLFLALLLQRYEVLPPQDSPLHDEARRITTDTTISIRFRRI